MRIASITTLAVLALLAGAAQAQVFCWTNKDGKRECGDTPPAGVKPSAIAAPAAPSGGGASPPPPAASGAKAGAKPPADPAMDAKKREMEASKAREKEQQAQEQATQKKQNCESAQNALRTLESGQRIARVGTDGERYFLDEQQIAQETQRARDLVQKNCN
jgi:hypothetical protein